MKRYFGNKKLGDVLESTMGPIANKHDKIMFRLINRWEQVVGSFLAGCTRPKSISFNGAKKTDGVLYIEVENPGFSLELQASERIIISKLSTFFGYEAIKSVKVVIARTRRPAVDDEEDYSLKQIVSSVDYMQSEHALDSIDDEELKEALKKLARNTFDVKKDS